MTRGLFQLDGPIDYPSLRRQVAIFVSYPVWWLWLAILDYHSPNPTTCRESMTFAPDHASQGVDESQTQFRRVTVLAAKDPPQHPVGARQEPSVYSPLSSESTSSVASPTLPEPTPYANAGDDQFVPPNSPQLEFILKPSFMDPSSSVESLTTIYNIPPHVETTRLPVADSLMLSHILSDSTSKFPNVHAGFTDLSRHVSCPERLVTTITEARLTFKTDPSIIMYALRPSYR
ncbi:hypothetical protein ONZ45_g7030 [Pleurotus djamor]|nr:hypothetical protein ONZ45_g7030 [Pleurotus djamor]